MNIDIRGLAFSYTSHDHVLRCVDLSVAAGELVALVGANGSGKSTLLKLVSGYLKPSGGEVLLDGISIGSLSPRAAARRLACLEQERRIDLDFSVREIVAMGRIPHRARFSRETARDRHAVREAMDITDTASLANRYIHTLSGGERQRVFLATALAQEPAALILDEPTTHFDIRYQMELMEIIKARAAAGIAVLIAVHDLTIAAAYADRIAILHDARIADDGSPSEVLTESVIFTAFGARVFVRRDPESQAMIVIPRRPGLPDSRQSEAT